MSSQLSGAANSGANHRIVARKQKLLARMRQKVARNATAGVHHHTTHFTTTPILRTRRRPATEHGTALRPAAPCPPSPT